MYLNRCTGFDHQCRVRYMLVLGDGEKRLDSGILDDVSDSDGKSYGWHPRYKFSELVTKVTFILLYARKNNSNSNGNSNGYSNSNSNSNNDYQYL